MTNETRKFLDEKNKKKSQTKLENQNRQTLKNQRTRGSLNTKTYEGKPRMF